jgi:hypothetical protein
MDEKKLYVLTSKNKDSGDCDVLGVFSNRDIACGVILTCMFEDGDRAVYTNDDAIREMFETDKMFYTIEEFTIDKFY